MRKWFSFDSKTQKVEVIEASEDFFASADEGLLFWSRGLPEWVDSVKALGHFLTKTEITPPEEPKDETKPTSASAFTIAETNEAATKKARFPLMKTGVRKKKKKSR